MKIKFTPTAKKQYFSWGEKNIKVLRRINALIRNVTQDPSTSYGDPVSLKSSLTGYWSRVIREKHKLIYKIEDDTMYIIQCEYQY